MKRRPTATSPSPPGPPPRPSAASAGAWSTARTAIAASWTACMPRAKRERAMRRRRENERRSKAAPRCAGGGVFPPEPAPARGGVSRKGAAAGSGRRGLGKDLGPDAAHRLHDALWQRLQQRGGPGLLRGGARAHPRLPCRGKARRARRGPAGRGPRGPVQHPGHHLHQQGRARDARAHRGAGGRPRGEALGFHVPRGLLPDSAPGHRKARLQQQLHHLRRRGPDVHPQGHPQAAEPVGQDLSAARAQEQDRRGEDEPAQPRRVLRPVREGLPHAEDHGHLPPLRGAPQAQQRPGL